MIPVRIKRLTETAKIPERQSQFSVGYDLYADLLEPVTIKPHETKKIGTGFSLELPIYYFGAIFARSGLSTKQGLRPANCVGVCDPDYRGEYIVAIHNDSEEERVIEPGDRIAQLVIMPITQVSFYETDELSETERGDGGFGHTGTK